MAASIKLAEYVDGEILNEANLVLWYVAQMQTVGFSPSLRSWYVPCGTFSPCDPSRR